MYVSHKKKSVEDMCQNQNSYPNETAFPTRSGKSGGINRTGYSITHQDFYHLLLKRRIKQFDFFTSQLQVLYIHNTKASIMNFFCLRVINFGYEEEIVVVVVCSGLTSLSTIFQSYYDGVWLRQGAQCSLL